MFIPTLKETFLLFITKVVLIIVLLITKVVLTKIVLIKIDNFSSRFYFA